MQFGEKLRELREEKDFTQKQVADLIGVSERVYGYYENNRFPKDEIILKKLASFFNVSLDWLVGDSDIKESAEDIINKKYYDTETNDLNKKDLKSKFNDRLCELRKEKGLSQYELANVLGYSRGQIGNYEQGTREPDHETIEKIAKFFNVSIDYLLGITDIKESAEYIINKKSSGTIANELNKKDLKSIEKDLEEIMQDISSPDSGFAAFDGNTDIDPEDIEMFENAMRIALTQIKKINKIKYNPNKSK